MAVALEQSTTWTGNGGTFAATFSAAPTEGNVLVAYIGQQSSNTWTASTGWTLLTKAYQGDEASFAYKIAGASETAAQEVATSNNTARNMGVWIGEYSGLDTTSLVIAENGATSYGTPKVTPTLNDTSAVAAHLLCGAWDSVATNTFSNNKVNSSTTGVTHLQDVAAGTASNGVLLGVWEYPIASTSGDYAGSCDTTGTGSGGGSALLLTQATAGGTTLVVAGLDHAVALDNVAVTQAHTLAVDALDLAVTVDNVSLAGATPLVAASLDMAVSVDAVVLVAPLARLVVISDTHAGLNTIARLEASSDLALSLGPTRTVITGDVSDNGLAAEFDDLDTNWGSSSMRQVVKVIPGNHDYLGSLSNFTTYWGSNTFTNTGSGIYGAEVVGNWHLIYLDLQSASYYASGSDQRVWLANYLSTHANRPMVAFWHYAPFSGGQMAPGHIFHATLGPGMADVWDELQTAGCELVITGHDHTNQRFNRRDSDGTLNSTGGMMSLVVAHSNNNWLSANSVQTPTLPEAYNTSSAFNGVTVVDLYADSFTWEFVGVSGVTYTDSGTQATRNTAEPHATLVVAALDVAVALDGVALTQAHTLTVAPLDVAVTLDAVTLVAAGQLVVAALDLGVALDGVALTQAHTLTVAALDVAVSVDGPLSLTEHTAGSLVVADVAHAVTLDAIAVTQAHTLTAAGIDHTVTLDNVALTVTAVQLVAAGITHTVTLDAPTLAVTHVLAVQSMLLAVSLASAETVAWSVYVGGVEVTATLQGVWTGSAVAPYGTVEVSA